MLLTAGARVPTGPRDATGPKDAASELRQFRTRSVLFLLVLMVVVTVEDLQHQSHDVGAADHAQHLTVFHHDERMDPAVDHRRGHVGGGGGIASLSRRSLLEATHGLGHSLSRGRPAIRLAQTL